MIPSDGSVRGRGGSVTMKGFDAASFPFPLNLLPRLVANLSSLTSPSDVTRLLLVPSLSFILREGRAGEAGERLAETDVEGGTGDKSLKYLADCADGDLDVDLEGPGGGCCVPSLATDGGEEEGSVPPSPVGRGVIEPDH